MSNFIQSFKKLDFAAKIRFILQILVYVNQAVIVLGDLPFAKNLWYQVVSLVLTILITALTYWKNNDWTGLARVSGDVLDILKDGKVTPEEVQEFIEEHSNTRD